MFSIIASSSYSCSSKLRTITGHRTEAGQSSLPSTVAPQLSVVPHPCFVTTIGWQNAVHRMHRRQRLERPAWSNVVALVPVGVN